VEDDSGLDIRIAPYPVIHLSKDRSKDILREIKALREDLDARIGRLEDAVGLSDDEVVSTDAGVPVAGASVQETEVSESGGLAPPKVISTAPIPGTASLPAMGVATPRNLSVVVRPLLDLSLARAVESSLGDTDGIENVRLTSLSGDSAVIDAQVSPGVSVISALRQKLPFAFDVTDSTDSSVTIELARPVDVEPGPGSGIGGVGT
jgi:hypothetical protein